MQHNRDDCLQIMEIYGHYEDRVKYRYVKGHFPDLVPVG